MKQLLYLLAFGLLFPAAALAQVDAEVAAQCKDARDFYGCVRAFATPAQHSNDIEPLVGVMGQVAAGLISGATCCSTNELLPGNDPAGRVVGIPRRVMC